MPFDDKEIVIDGKAVNVGAEKVGPNSYRFTAALNGKTSEHVLTVGANSDGVNIPTVEELQAAVDAARQTAAAHVVLHATLEQLEGQIT